MWLHKRRYEVVLTEKRKKDAESLAKAVEAERKANEEKRRQEEEVRRSL